MSTINERIRQLMEYYGLNKNSFSVRIGMGNNTAIGKIVNDPDRKPSYDVIMKILNAFPDVSRKWFIEGVGDMIINDPRQRTMSMTDMPDDDYDVRVVRLKKGEVLIIKGTCE